MGGPMNLVSVEIFSLSGGMIFLMRLARAGEIWYTITEKEIAWRQISIRLILLLGQGTSGRDRSNFILIFYGR